MTDKPTQGNSDWIHVYHLELVDEVDCDEPKCQWPGRVWLRTTCCGDIVISCQIHLVTAQATIASLMSQRKMLMCKACGTAVKPDEWLTKPVKL